MEAVLVDIVSRVVTPSATRAGTAFGSIQNENLGNMKKISLSRCYVSNITGYHETMTSMQVGT